MKIYLVNHEYGFANEVPDIEAALETLRHTYYNIEHDYKLSGVDPDTLSFDISYSIDTQ